MSRLLYARHVPADPLLAPVFADMPPDQPELLADWLAEALGGPARQTGTGARKAIGATANEFGEEHRTRWVWLASQAADDAKLPGDPGFRSALASCLDWTSRTALTMPPGGTADQAPVPRWDWGPGGPPPAADAGQATDDARQPEGPLPGPDQAIGFAAHIKPLFREHDRQSMSFAFDLWSYDDVRAHGADILSRLRDGSMPCDGAWPTAKVDVFSRWLDTGTLP